MTTKYRYETHLHTSPVSKCASGSVKDTLDFYRQMEYDGVFITNHFLDGNINISHDEPLEKRLDFYYSDYEEALRYGKQIGIKVFLGEELSYGGTDFLVYGLAPSFFYEHPELYEMKKSEELAFLRENGAFIIQAHPFREAKYIDHIRLFPRSVDGVEVINACRTDFENRMARIYAEEYGLLITAGTDNHRAGTIGNLAGVLTATPINSEEDYIRLVRERKVELFFHPNEQPENANG